MESVGNIVCGMIAGSEGSREWEDWMSEVKDNIRLGLEDGWIKVGAERCEKCGSGKLVEG